MTTKSYEKMLEEIGNMTLVELNDFVKSLEEKFGISTAQISVGGGQAAAASAPAAAEEKAEYKVTLKAIGDKKIEVIKALKKVTTMSLTEARDAVTNAPTVIGSAEPKEKAEAMKKALEEAGAQVELA